MIEYRNAGEAKSEGGVLRGLVTPFNVWTTIGDKRKGGFDERVALGTFKKTLQERDVVLIDAHDKAKPMARTSIREGVGALSLKEVPDDGLRAVAFPVDTSYARDVMACTDAGVTRGMSFGFEVIKDSWTDDDGNPSNSSVGTKRTIHEVRLHEVTTTAFPAYETTQLSARDTINAARGVMEARADGSPKPYGDVEYADPKNGKYPIDTEEHARAAWSYINMPKNAEKYPLNGVTVGEVKAKIKAALHKFGVTTDEQNAIQVEAIEMRDAVDGDDPNGEFYQAFTNGAISDLEQISTMYSHQIPANVADAIAQICAFHKSLGEHVPAAGGTGGDGITPPSPMTSMDLEAKSEDDDWEMRARVAMIQAQTRETERLMADLAR